MVVRHLLSTLAVCALSTAVSAASIGIYFDSAGTDDEGQLAAFGIVEAYVVVRDLGGDLSGYEFSIEHSSALNIIGATMIPAGGINVGGGTTDWIVGVGQCLPDQNARPILKFSALLLREESNLVLSLGPASSSSVYGEGPAYALCTDQIGAFDEVGWAVINPNPESFGGVKRRYGD